MKTENKVMERSRTIGWMATWGVLLTSILTLIATSYVRPSIWDNYSKHPWGFIFPLLGLSGLIAMFFFRKQNKDTATFFSSCAFISGMGAGTAFSLYPNVLTASTDPAYSLTIYNSSTSAYGLGVGLIWWSIGMILTVAYFSYLLYSFRGKVELPAEGDGY